jgi:transposase
VPGIGPILAMIILAEARDVRRFGCVRQFLKWPLRVSQRT